MQKFLRSFVMLALFAVPWVTEAQVAKVSEYDFAADTVAYTSIVGNGGTAWSAADLSNGYTTITMPFAMQYGQTSIGRGNTLYVSADGYVTTGDANMTGIVIAPMSTTAGFTGKGANTIYTKVENNKVTVEWRKLKVGNNIVSFQLQLTNTGIIRFQYGPMTLNATAQIFAGMQSSTSDVYCINTENNRWDTIVPSYLNIATTRTLSPAVHPYYDVDQSKGLRYTFTQPECAKPNSFGAVPGDYNVIFNWTGNGSKYQIKYNEGADFTPMTEGILLDNLTGNTTTVNDLPQRTTYYAYIRAFCSTSGSWSAWRAVADNFFSTGCGYEPLPMVQDFTADIVCWDFLASNTEAPYTVRQNNDMLYMRAGNETDGYANDVYAVLPRFNANLNNYEFDLTARVESTTYGTLTLGYLTNINNLSGFVALTEITGLTTSYQDIALYLTDYAAIPSNARLALKWFNDYSYYDCYIDEITVKPQPTCFPISGLQVSDITPTSAKFSFTDNHSTSTSYQLVLGAPGFDPDEATPVTITNGQTLTTLEGSTHYEAYVRSLCGSESNAWVGPVAFTTPCPTITVSAANPFRENFDGSDVPDCWNKEGFSSSDWYFDNGVAYGSSSSCSSDCEAWLYSPKFSFGTGDIILSFKHKQQDWSGDQNYLTVYYRTSPSDEWHQLVQYTNSISDWTNEELTLPNTTNATEYQLAFTSTNHYGYAVYLDNIKVRPAPACVSPTDLAISSSKVLTWTAGNATQWQVRYKMTTDETYTTLIVNAATATLPLTGEAGTQYEISVRSICGVGDTNDWLDPIYYTMPISLPFSCDFENGATGFITLSTASNEWVVGTANSNGGSHGYYVSNDGTSNVYAHGANIAYAYVTLPFETAGDYIVKYDWTANGESTWDFLRVALVPDNVTLITSYSNSYNSTTPSGWIAIDGGSKLNLNTNWNTRTEAVTITEPGNYKLVFAWMNDGSGGSQPPAAIDNVSVRMLSCNMPTNIALNSDGAVAWTAGNTTQWQVRWAEDGSSNYTEAFVSTPSYTSTSWTPNTSYTIDIRSICGANDTLDWATYNFTMPCVAIAISDASPYSENFESYTNAPSGYESAGADVPECWDLIPAIGVVTRAPHVGTQGAINGKGLVMTAGTSDCWPNNYAILPAFTAPVSLLQINFDYKCETASSNWLSIGYITNPNDTSSFVALATYNGSTSVASKEFSFAGNTIPAGARIAFRWYRSASYYWINIDNVVVSVVPTCVKPVVTAATTTTSGAEIAWTEINSATTWRLLYGPAGFNPETQGTMMTATTNPVTLTGLNSNTSYDVYVRSVCEAGVDSSAWSNAYSFRTACGEFQSLPYAEDFSSYTGIPSSPTGTPVTTPYCWNYYSNGTNTPTSSSSYYGSVISYGYTSSYGCMVANNPYLCMPIQITGANVTNSTYINYETQRGNTKIAAMPLFDQPLSNLMVSFDYKMSTAYSATGAATTLELGYITDNDFSTFESMQSWNAVTTTQTISEMSLATLAANAPDGARLAFRFTGVHNGTGSYSYSTVYCGIDNIQVKLIPNCFAPLTSTFEATNVTPTSATVSWTDRNNNNPTTWKVKYSTDANFNPATDGVATTVNTTSIDLTGLADQTTYYIYVGVDCGAFGESEWSDAFTFTTPCFPMTITLDNPFIEDFEETTFPPSACWQNYHVSGPGTTLWQRNTTNKHNGTAGAYIADMNATTLTNLVCPPIAIGENEANGYGVSFWMYRNATGTSKANEGVRVWANTTPTTEGATLLAHAHRYTGLEPVVSSTGWYKYEADIPLTGTVYIIFEGVCEYGSASYMDEIKIEKYPTCRKPADVHTTALAYNAATIDWTQNSTQATEGSWEVMFGESPLDITTATVTTLSDHVFNATNLDENTTYDFYVRANCGADGIGEWSDVFTFTTPCAPMEVTKYQPYIYGFEDVAGTGSTQPINACWAKGTNSTTKYPYPAATASYLSANTNPITPTNNYYLQMYATTSYYSYAVLPEFSNPLNTLQLTLKAMRTSSTATYGVLEIGYMTDPTDISTFVSVQQVQPDYVASPNYNWQSFTTFYDNVEAPAGARMAFRAPALGTDYVYVDDIEVMPIPTCRVATDLVSENVYAKTADLSWTEHSAATPAMWEVRYAPAAANLDNEGESIYITTTPATTLTNLVPETAYQWKVRPICVAAANYEGDTADWSTVATFTTTATCVVPVLGTPIATANSVTLSWTEKTLPVPATQWEVAVGEAGFNQNIAGKHFITNQNTSFLVEGLKHSTSYEVYVRSLCSDEDWSNWSTVANFNTLCGAWQYADMPLVQTFSVAGLPNCWTKAGGTADVSAANNRVNIYGSNSMVILPEMGFALDTVDVSLEAANYNGTTERSFQVGYLEDKDDTTTFTAVQTITLNSASYNEYKVSFADIASTTARYIAIRGLQTGTSWADFNVKNVQVKLREPIVYLPSTETAEHCGVFYLADTVGNVFDIDEGTNTYAGNLNMIQTIYPGEPGKVLHLTGKMDCENGYDYLTIYEGVGTNGRILYSGTGYDANIDVKSDSYDWSTNGAMTIVFTTDVDNAEAYEGFKLYAECVCPAIAPEREWIVDTNTAFTWVNGRTYSNNVTVANQPDKSWSEEYMEKNIGGCDSVYHTLQLTIHPTYTLTDNKTLCARESYEFYGETLTATGSYTRTAQTVYGADSTTTLTLQVRPAPTAYIYVNNERTNGTIDAFCDNADLVMTARATIEGSTFKWDDNSTDAVRTVNPHESNTYTLVAYHPEYGCASLPVELTVTTTPVPVLSIEASNEAICVGGTTTLTVSDANNTGCTYLWSNGQTGNSITVSPAATTEYTVTATTPNASACTATASATITVNPLPEVVITPSATEICRFNEVTLAATEKEGYVYDWTNLNNAATASVTFEPAATGRYNLTVTDTNGCVNTFTSANVTVRPAYNINDTMSVCEAMLPYTWGTQSLNDVEGGDYDQTWSIAYGCDSTVHLHLDVTATGVSNAYATYCEGAAFSFGTGDYKTDHVANLKVNTLSYIDTTSDVCPVQYNLFLTVNPVKATSFEANECDSYTWNETVYTTAGSHIQNLKTINECDSVVTLNLTLRTSTTGTDVQTPCDKLVWIDGKTYTEDNHTAQYTIANEAGCDSLVTLDLTLRHANTGIFDTIICKNRTYTWRNGVTYDMNETDGNVRYTLPGITNQAGCDSVQILNLVFYLPTDTMAWADTAVCDILILDTVTCNGDINEYQISQSGAYVLPTPISNGRYVISRYNVTINTSEYHTIVKRNACLPYTWYDADSNIITVINDIYSSRDTNISLTFGATEKGCDRTEVLRLINTKAQSYMDVDTAICLGSQFDAYGFSLTPTAAGTETYRLATGETNANGCDSTIRLTLTTHPTVTEEMELDFCENVFKFDTTNNVYSYTFVNEEKSAETVELTYPTALNGVVFDSSVVANWTTENGCTRTVTINYTVKPNTSNIFDTTVLYTYTWNEVTYDNEGVYTDNVVVGENQYGCDSLMTLNLTLYDTVYTVFDTTVCTSYKGPDGKTYREDMSFTETIEGASQYGTDSVIVTNYHVNQNPLTDVYVASTNPYMWIDGVEYTANGEAFFTKQDINGCDSTVHLFFTRLDTIVLCEEALPDTTVYGFIINEGAVNNTYMNNDANGNDTIVSYVINKQTHNVLVDNGCDSYTWSKNDSTYTESGVYVYNYTNAKGCVSADTLKLTVYYNTNSSEIVEACDTYTWNNNDSVIVKTVSGTYTNHYLTTNDCPSTDTLYLTVKYNTNSDTTAVACDSLSWNGTVYAATGDYTYEYNAANGCASVDTLHLTIGTAGKTTIDKDVCDSFTWTENNTTYIASTVDSVVLQSIAGCDSTIFLNLIVRNSTDTTVVVDACDTYTWAQNNETYTATGNYIDTIENVAGCDSVVTLNLTVKYNSNAAFTETACDTYTWNNNDSVIVKTVSGTYTNNYINADGCQSVDTLYLTVNNSSSYDTTIYSSEGFYLFSYVANDVTYDTLFQANAPTTFGPLTATINNAAGCDSVITFTFVVGTTRNKTEVVMACQEYTWPRNNVTYVYIDTAERNAHNGALYKTSTGTYIYEAPIVTINSDTAINSTYILNLILTERYTGTADTTFLLSNNTLTLGDSVFDFTAQKAAGYIGYTETVQRTVTHPAVQYCDSVVTYNITLVYNYDTTTVAICADSTPYTWGTQTIATTTPGSTYELDSIGTDGWLRHLVINQAPVYASTDTRVACDSLVWIDGLTYFADTTTATKVLPAADGCDSTVTLNLTVNISSHVVYIDTACDRYTWNNNDSVITKTESGVYTNQYNNDASCPSVDTLYLTINKNAGHAIYDTVCDSYTWHGTPYAASTVAYYEYNDDNNCPSKDTLNLIVNVSTSGTDEITACDSLKWIDSITYYINNFTATKTITNAAGCDSVVTLNLTVNHATHNVTVKADACDSYVWETSGQNYSYDSTKTYPDTIIHEYVNGQNCPSADTLFLTIKQSSSETFYDTACNTYTWVNNGNTITKTESGMYTSNYTNAAGCASTDMLYLTIRNSSTGYDSIITSDGYYYYNNVLYTADYTGGDYFDTVFPNVPSGLNAAGCDSVTNVHLLVGVSAIGMQNVVECDQYTWINGKTYKYRENAPEGALYWNATDNEWVMARPRYTLDIPTANGFDSIMILNLTLTQINYSEKNVSFLLSQGTCYLTADSAVAYSIDFSNYEAGTLDTVFHFTPSSHYCDSVITYHITLIDNYSNIGTEDICATAEEYIWNNTNVLGGHNKTFDLTEMITDFDHVSTITLTDTVFKGDANNEWVYAKTLTVHPMVYATERRTVCDSLRWNGTLFTESTTTATRFFANGSSFGCDSTVTLNLTVKYNSNTAYTVDDACDEYKWNLNNETYTTSGTYYRSYTAATSGCPSVDTLYLTVNYNSSKLYTKTACDSMTWNGTKYTTSGTYYHDYNTTAGCASQDTLVLTVNYNSNKGETKVICDSYTWHDSTYTASTTAYYSYNAENTCPSMDTLYLTINKNNGQDITETVCDSYTWTVNGQTYTESGNYTYDSTDANGCYAQCKLALTVGYTTNNAETVIACHSYDWSNNGWDTTINASGDYTHAYDNGDNCPSVDTLHLTINNQTTYAVQTVENCGPYTWIVNDSTIGVFEQSLETQTTLINPRTMCDSVVFLRLTVYEAPHAYESATICADALPYTWRGIQFTAAGDTAITTAFTANCDSTIHFALTVNPLISVELTDAICLGNDYDANGFVIAATELTAGTHTFSHTVPSVLTGCDSTTTLTITVGDVIYNDTVEVTACDTYSWAAGDGETYVYTTSGTYNSGIYANAMGCSSIDVLALTINNNSSTGYNATACDTYTWNNAEYNATGDYTFEYNDGNGCASVDTLHLTINNNSSTGYTVTACDSYEWNDVVYTTSGDYTFDYSTNEGCTSVDTLHLTINYNSNAGYTITACDSYMWNDVEYTTSGIYYYNYNNGNCPSVDTLFLTVNYNSNAAFTDTACDSYTWTNGNRMTYTTSGTYYYNYNTTAGCASVDTLYLTVNYNSSTGSVVTACDSYEWNGQTFTSTGVYYYPYNTAEGCSSLDTLRLTVNYNSNAAFTETACDSYTWNGVEYTTSGTYQHSYDNLAGCPSTDTLHLTVNYNSNSSETATVCDSYTWNDVEYTTSGTYYYNYNNATNGCASVDTLYLTVKYNSNKQRTIIACDEYTWNGETYYQTGDYLYEYEAVNNCPSVDTLHLTVNYSTSTRTEVNACDEYTWLPGDGETYFYTESGTYIVDYIATNNCESYDTLVLVVNETKNYSFDLTACDSYTWNDTTYTQSGSYTINTMSVGGCDSTATLNLTINNSTSGSEIVAACGSYEWHGQTYNQTGLYTFDTINANGCDSTATLSLIINQSVTSTEIAEECDSYTWHGVTYTQSGVYVDTTLADGGCDNIATLLLTIKNSTHNSETVTACNNYTWNITEYTTSGTKLYNYTNAAGCASVDTLHLTINNATNGVDVKTACESYEWMDGVTYTASTTSPTFTLTGANVNGCDSIVTLNLTIKHATTGSENVTTCDSYIWNEETFTQSGDYTRTLEAANECDSIVTLHLTINNSNTGIDEQVACGSFTWIDNVTYMTSTTTPTFTLTNFAGCDSVVTLNLTINQPVTAETTLSACDSMEWNGTTYTTSGDYTFHTSASNSCDSTVTLHLTINHSNTGIDEQVACGSFTWIDGVTYTTSTTAPTFTLTGANVNGCDSVVTLNLTINNATSFSETVTTCVSYTWNGVTYNQSGDYTYTTSGINGCDSVATLHLTINQPVAATVTRSECVSYLWNGTNYTESGIYYDTTVALNGCDSITTLVLSIKNNVYTYTEASACDSYTWNNATYTASGNYTYTTDAANGCDSIVTLILTVNASSTAVDEQTNCDSYIWIDGVEYTESTNTPTFTLTNAYGCDSVVTLNLTINHSVERYDTVNILSTELPYNYYGNTLPEAGEYIFNEQTINGCDSTVYLVLNVEIVNSIDVVNVLDNLKAYPNPTHGHLTLTADQVVKVEVMDIVGRKVATFEGTNSFDISNLAEGTYTLRITLPEGVAVRKVIKK